MIVAWRSSPYIFAVQKQAQRLNKDIFQMEGEIERAFGFGKAMRKMRTTSS